MWPNPQFSLEIEELIKKLFLVRFRFVYGPDTFFRFIMKKNIFTSGPLLDHLRNPKEVSQKRSIFSNIIGP